MKHSAAVRWEREKEKKEGMEGEGVGGLFIKFEQFRFGRKTFFIWSLFNTSHSSLVQLSSAVTARNSYVLPLLFPEEINK